MASLGDLLARVNDIVNICGDEFVCVDLISCLWKEVGVDLSAQVEGLAALA